MTLTEFLLARIAEDESNGTSLIGAARKDWHVRWLAECEAKRRIIEYADEVQAVVSLEQNGVKGASVMVRCGLPILKALALPYADHPDYPGDGA